ncbi:MAG TPA: LPS export ABC transporter periplasmic protein LptC [Longimicrobium sp.]|nr:LPS export ABC transporter periplasmic protein LptC [Longimicrobium sp.]
MTRFRTILLLAVGFPLAAACDEAPAAPGVAVGVNSNQVTVGMRLKITEAGRQKADLTADSAETPAGQTVTALKKVHLVFYEPGRKPSNLTSKTGDYDQQNGMMTARGNVVLVTQGDKGMRTITTQELHWDQRADRVWSTVETTIVENGQTLISDGFTSNAAFTNVQGKNGRVKGVRVGEGGLRF